jgi:hypothetical protein
MNRCPVSPEPELFKSVRYAPPSNALEKREIMGACQCGYTTDPEKNCNGTHNVVKAVKADLAEKLEAAGFPHAAEFVKNN